MEGGTSASGTQGALIGPHSTEVPRHQSHAVLIALLIIIRTIRLDFISREQWPGTPNSWDGNFDELGDCCWCLCVLIFRAQLDRRHCHKTYVCLAGLIKVSVWGRASPLRCSPAGYFELVEHIYLKTSYDKVNRIYCLNRKPFWKQPPGKLVDSFVNDAIGN